MFPGSLKNNPPLHSRARFEERQNHEYPRQLDESSRRTNQSDGFDIEGIRGTRLMPFSCEGLSTFTYPYRPLVNRYAKLGLYRYNMKELTVYTNDRKISDEDLSKLEIVKVAIETYDEPPLKAKSSVLYITFKGLGRNGSGEQLERKAIINSVFNEQTGSLSLKGDLCKSQDDVTLMTVEEMHYHFRQSLGAV